VISYLFPPETTAAGNAPNRRRDTKGVGDRSELEVMGALIRNGYRIALPFGENHRYDLIADDGERLYRVQVKTGRLRRGAIRMTCQSAHWHRRRPGREASRSYRGQIDFLAVYCPDNRKVYVVPESEMVGSSGHLRVDRPLNGQQQNIRWARTYELP
jgi:hypothetical protein